MKTRWSLEFGESPLVMAAIHDGHDVRTSLQPSMKLSESERLREEDPFTRELAEDHDNRIVVSSSRFEIDLNRSRDRSIYRQPEDAWGQDVWSEDVNQREIEKSLSLYDQFNLEVDKYIRQLLEIHSSLVVYDLHSYNHLRLGAKANPADSVINPVVNVGTASIASATFRPVVDTFLGSMCSSLLDGKPLDVRENVKFYGGDFARRLHHSFPEQVCVLSVEFKKVFMNEWTNELYSDKFEQLKDALRQTIVPTTEALKNLPAT